MEREQTTIRLPADLKEKLQQEAARRGISFNAMVLLSCQRMIADESGR